MILRDYQKEAVEAGLDALSSGESIVIAAPTGSGKSLMLAAMADALAVDGATVLVLTHRKELIAQNERHLEHFGAKTSVYSAGLNRRETDGAVLIAGIASVYRKPELWINRDYVIVDEAHLVPSDDSTMYGQLFRTMEHAPKAGLTATPYRLDGGLIYGAGQWFDSLAYQISAKELVAEGYLAALNWRVALHEASTDGVRIRAGEFVAGDLEQSVCDDDQVRKAIREARAEASGRAHILVFAVSIVHAEMVHQALTSVGETAVIVHSKMGGNERDEAISAFMEAQARWCVNVGILTTGFDFPALDCIVLLRPTASRSFHVQCLGRGMRTADGKDDCLVLDFSGNCARHGAIDLFDTVGKTNEKLEAEQIEQRRRAQERKLPVHVLRQTDPMHGNTLPLAVTVHDVAWKTTPAARYPGKTNVMVIYKTSAGQIRKWLCPEYETGARWYAKRFAAARGLSYPMDTIPAQRYLEMMRRAPRPLQLAVRRGESGYFDVIAEYFD